MSALRYLLLMVCAGCFGCFIGGVGDALNLPVWTTLIGVMGVSLSLGCMWPKGW